MFCPCNEGKELPCPICEPGWQLCDCGECRAEQQLASPGRYLWIQDVPSTVFRSGVLADSKCGQTKPMSACRIPRSSISFLTPFTICFPVWLQLVLFSPACQLSPAIRCSQQADHHCVPGTWHWSLHNIGGIFRWTFVPTEVRFIFWLEISLNKTMGS